MKLYFRIFIVAALFFMLAACKKQPILQVDNIPVSYSDRVSITADEVRDAIIKAGKDSGWRMTPAGTGHLEGSYILRKHTAVVDIAYTSTSYDIHYKKSVNLKYDGTSIHRAYNSWVRNLKSAIDKRLAMAHYK